MAHSIDIDSAEDLAAWINRMNLSLPQAATRLGRQKSTILRYIGGKRDVPEKVARRAAAIEASRHIGRLRDTGWAPG
jgi:hypothetical protein